jgi:hypothetical protein
MGLVIVIMKKMCGRQKDGGASWILVTFRAGWTGKKSLHLGFLPIAPPSEDDALVDSSATMGLVSR